MIDSFLLFCCLSSSSSSSVFVVRFDSSLDASSSPWWFLLLSFQFLYGSSLFPYWYFNDYWCNILLDQYSTKSDQIELRNASSIRSFAVVVETRQTNKLIPLKTFVFSFATYGLTSCMKFFVFVCSLLIAATPYSCVACCASVSNTKILLLLLLLLLIRLLIYFYLFICRIILCSYVFIYFIFVC